MRSFRARYGRTTDAGLRVEVIGYHCESIGTYSAPRGLPSWRVMMFHRKTEVTLETGAFRVEPHTLFAFPPGARTTYGRRAGAWCNSWIRFTGRAANALVAGTGVPANWPVRFASSTESDRWLPLIHEELQHASGGDPEIVRGLLRVWLREVRRHARDDETARIPEAFVRAKRFVETSYLERITLAGLAALAGLSRQHLCEGFRRHFGVTPVDYAIDLRMRHAAELLGDENLTVTRVAEACGFGDVYHFSKAFKKRTGTSPTAYRRRRGR